jgi:hypothetical protein
MSEYSEAKQRVLTQMLQKLDEKMIQDNAGLENQHYLTYHLHFATLQPPYDNLYFTEVGPNNDLEFIFDFSDIPHKDFETKLTIKQGEKPYCLVLNMLLHTVPFIVDANGRKIEKE